MDYKLTDVLAFHPDVQKFRIANMPENVSADRKVFISIGQGGKGSEYMFLTAEEALELARYLMVEAHKALQPTKGTAAAKSSKK